MRAGGGHHGFGLRPCHYDELLDGGAKVPWVEAVTENFLGRGGRPAAVLERVRRTSRLALHGVSLSIGGTDPLDDGYLVGLRDLRRATDAEIVSDHLCFGSFGGHRGHDLWPLPFTEEALRHVVSRLAHVQERLGTRIALENVSSYVECTASEMTEWEFVREVATRADALLLVDVNNVFVSAHNHGFDARTYLDGLPGHRVAQFHLAGHSVREGYLFDDHGSPVPAAVRRLHAYAVGLWGPRPTIVEWDEGIPPLTELVKEAERSQEGERGALAEVLP